MVTTSLGLPGLALLIVFFAVGTAATRLGYAVKAARGIAQERGGARGWRHAWANGAIPAFLALMAALAPPLLRDLLVLAYAASVATAAADTCSSEIAKAYGRRTVLVTTLRPVPPDTEGAVSLEGTLAGLVRAALVASAGAGPQGQESGFGIAAAAWAAAAAKAASPALGRCSAGSPFASVQHFPIPQLAEWPRSSNPVTTSVCSAIRRIGGVGVGL